MSMQDRFLNIFVVRTASPRYCVALPQSVITAKACRPAPRVATQMGTGARGRKAACLLSWRLLIAMRQARRGVRGAVCEDKTVVVKIKIVTVRMVIQGVDVPVAADAGDIC